MDPQAGWLSPQQAAGRLGLSTDRVRQLTAQGRLRFRPTPLGRLIDPEDVERMRLERARNANPVPAA
jgi:excisionase family DNA binding protein